jgi:hypothetical protein
MRKIKMVVELEYDEKLMGETQEEKDWFNNDILLKDTLILHSNEIGDEIGTLKVIDILK